MALIAAPLLNKKINPYKQSEGKPKHHHGRSRASSHQCIKTGMSKTDDDLQMRGHRKNKDYRSQKSLPASNLVGSRKISISHPEKLHCLVGPSNSPSERVEPDGRKSPQAKQNRKSPERSSDQRITKQPATAARKELFSEIMVMEKGRPRGMSATEAKELRRAIIKSQTRPSVKFQISTEESQFPLRKRSRSEQCITDAIRAEMLAEASRSSESPTSSSGGNPFAKMMKNFRKFKIGSKPKSEEDLS